MDGAMVDRWNIFDGLDWQKRIKDADERLRGWARWQRNAGIRIDYPPESSFVKVMKPPDEEEQAGARHVSVMPTDVDALEVETILTRWRMHARLWRYWRIIDIEYRTGGSSDQKAKRLARGLDRREYRHRVEHVQIILADELGLP